MKNVIQKGVVSRTLAHTHFAPKRKVLFLTPTIPHQVL